MKETIDANTKLGADDALNLARGASTVIVSRGKKIIRFAMKKDAPADDELLGVMLGPTGNLRAPTIRRGVVLLVGFNEDVYTETL